MSYMACAVLVLLQLPRAHQLRSAYRRYRARLIHVQQNIKHCSIRSIVFKVPFVYIHGSVLFVCLRPLLFWFRYAMTQSFLEVCVPACRENTEFVVGDNGVSWKIKQGLVQILKERRIEASTRGKKPAHEVVRSKVEVRFGISLLLDLLSKLLKQSSRSKREHHYARVEEAVGGEKLGCCWSRLLREAQDRLRLR